MKLCTTECQFYKILQNSEKDTCIKYMKSCKEDTQCIDDMDKTVDICRTDCKYCSINKAGCDEAYCKRYNIVAPMGFKCLQFNPDKGLKYDKDKDRWDLLPLHLIKEAVVILTKGCVKYGSNTWQKLEDGRERYFAALMRHLVAYREGDKIDEESGITHLAHVLCNLMFLDYLDQQDDEE